MIQYICYRLLLLVPSIMGVITIVAIFLHLVPGDPLDQILGPYSTEQQKIEVREQLGLDQSIFNQVFSYFTSLLQADLGSSLLSGEPVISLIQERLAATLSLALSSLFVSVWAGLTVGFLCALKEQSWLDLSLTSIVTLALAIPNFWLGPMLIYFFSIQLKLFPVSGNDSLLHFVLPSLTLGLSLSAVLARMTRTSLLENVSQDYAKVAKAKGLSGTAVLLKHVLKNSSLSILTITGLQLGVLLGGSIITEQIFDWPGLGTLLIDAIHSRDYPLIQGCVLFIALGYLFVNLAVDLLYTYLDPRIVYE